MLMYRKGKYQVIIAVFSKNKEISEIKNILNTESKICYVITIIFAFKIIKSNNQ